MFATASSSKLTLSNSTPLTTIELELVKSQFSLSTESIPQSHPPYSYSSKEYRRILHRRGIRPPYAPDDPVYIRVNKDSHKYMVDDNEGGGETEGEVDYEQPSVVVDVVSHAAEADIAHLKHELAMANAQNQFQSHSMSRQPWPCGWKKVLSEPYNILVAHKKTFLTSKKLPMVNFLQQHATEQAVATKSITISSTTSAPFSAPISASAPVSAPISASTSTSALASTSGSASTSTTISHESSLSLSAGTGLIANPAKGVRADQLCAYTPNPPQTTKGFSNHTKQYIHLFLATQDAFLTIEVLENFIVNAVWFANTDMGVGVKISTDIQKMVIALTAIVIHNGITQWRETGELKNISLEDKNSYCAKYHKILEHLDIVQIGRPTYFGAALQTSLYQQGMAMLGITIQHAGSDDDHFTIGDDITPDSAISPSMSPLPVPVTCSKHLLYQAATWDNSNQSDLEHWESSTSDMDSGDDSDNGSVILADDLDA
ncbi:hypothetical protein BU17DRAFT_98557 [Hysterangium stoloniferum]|nr:hypothetical protein BU17DRAFT_98557 [Hysterangium stoloniferum]